MSFACICLFITQFAFLQRVTAVYNKDVICIRDPGKATICTVSPRISRRNTENELPSHDPYIPRNNSILYNCSVECKVVSSKSLAELVSPNLNLKSCFLQSADNYECESIRYHHLKNVDKLLFLTQTIRNRKFYTVDCLIYSGGERVCTSKDSDNSILAHANLVDTGTLVKPNDQSILAQDEFICEETSNKEIDCDLNPFVPFEGGLKIKESLKFDDSVLLKSGSHVAILNRKCKGFWCGYSGQVTPTRRLYNYRVPGGTVYRCYYAKKQQICKQWYALHEKSVYNDRGYL